MFGNIRTKIPAVLMMLFAGTALSACEQLYAMAGPTRHIVIEADAAELAELVQAGKSRDAVMAEAIDVIDHRLSALSPLPPEIKIEGENRISIHVSGMADVGAVQRALEQRGMLQFKLADEAADPDQTAKGVARIGSEILPFAEGGGFLAVRRLGGISGKSLVRATPSMDVGGQAAVSIEFDKNGAKKFATMTSQNVGRLFAIVLDGEVISAPRINEPIYGGSSIISGSFTTENANDLAISLNSGALPVNFKVIESRFGE